MASGMELSLYETAYRLIWVIGTCYLAYKLGFSRTLAGVPTVGGPSTPLLSYLGSYAFIKDSRAILQHGYEKYKGHLFKVAMLDRWLVVVTGSKLIEELRKMPENEMSLHESLCQIFEMDYTLGKTIRLDPYHAPLLHSQLTKHLGTIYGPVNEEIVAAIDDLFGDIGKDYTSVPILDITRQIVLRATNRALVGLPLCRNPDYLRVQDTFTRGVAKARMVINVFPPLLKPLAGTYLTTVPASVRACLEHLRPLINERKAHMSEHGTGSYAEKPMDMLQWFMDAAHSHPVRSTDRELAIRTLVLNFASIHTTANTFVHALLTLATHPEHLPTMRAEVETVISSEGWTKAAMSQLVFMDAFFKESTRVNPLNGLAVTRIAMVPHTFSDGTTVPAGTFLGAPTTATHADPENYPNPEVFDPARFLPSLDVEKEGLRAPQYLASTSPSWIAFGHGKSACPGRFFAAAEMKAMLAHFVLEFDIEAEVQGVRPKDHLIGITNFPDPNARVMLRKRIRL